MENQENKPGGLQSIIPLLVVGGGVLVFMQFFSGPSPTEHKENNVHQAKIPTSTNRPKNDFVFTEGGGDKTLVDNGLSITELSSKGGRITRYYVKSHDDLRVPETVIKEQNDPIATEHRALEITRGNGMDFQPHLYFKDDAQVAGAYQMASPPLNDAKFQASNVLRDAKTGATEIRYRLPVRVKDQNLEIIKVYRFFKNESFFHQITVIRNMDKKELTLGGDLYYKTFGDLGPAPYPNDDRDAAFHGRFFYYAGSLDQRPNIPPSNSILAPIGCGEKLADMAHTIRPEYKGKVGPLDFVGAQSRYLIAYSRFLGPEGSSHKPNGIILRNQIDPAGREASTTFFSQFKLGPAQGGDVELGSPAGNVNADGSIRNAETGNHALIVAAQKRPDLLVIDSQVFVGQKNEDSHSIHNEALALAEYGEAKSDSTVRKVLYSSTFLSIFSGVRDGIVWLMHFAYKWIGNWGWVIIIIAVFFKLITFPLNQMQAKSMKRMSLLKPEMDKINAKYADNPQEKQKRTMELYKKHNINPMKGCLPILIQMPIFIALYSAFSESIDLWHSPFALWMTDLSRPDTIYVFKDLFIAHNVHINILPLIMVGSQIAQQRLTTVTADPQQKMLMYVMPFVMLLFFWSIPSGVTLYWTVQNIIAVIWQVVAERFASGKDEPAK
ncbi:MAG: membrane protein insertase YidC [Spirochaetia bacterium]|nr:membrane protein insertase YidC [Spirochaetia bacterium]